VQQGKWWTDTRGYARSRSPLTDLDYHRRERARLPKRRSLPPFCYFVNKLLRDARNVTVARGSAIIRTADQRGSIMRTFGRTAVFALATFGIVFAGVTVDHSVVSVLACNGSNCGTGEAGNGGVNSDGKARGGSFSATNPGPPTVTITFSGNVGTGTGHYTLTSNGTTTETCSGQGALHGLSNHCS
jgi:hypothetical protein